MSPECAVVTHLATDVQNLHTAQGRNTLGVHWQQHPWTFLDCGFLETKGVELTAGRTALGVHWQQHPWTGPHM